MIRKECYPESMKSYDKAIKEANEWKANGSLRCSIVYLTKYCDLAYGKADDYVVNELFEHTKKLIHYGMVFEGADKVASASQYVLNEMNAGRGERANDAFAIVSEKKDVEVMSKLLNVLEKAVHAKSRLEKVEVIEGFVDISHRDFPIMSLACAKEGKSEGDDKITPFQDIAWDVFECLSR